MSIKTSLDNSIDIPVVESLPANNASRAGNLFWYNGTLWTFAKSGQFGGLAEGVPWPVKGYKELVIRIDYNDSSGSIDSVKINDFNGSYSISRNGTGRYDITSNSPIPNSMTREDVIANSFFLTFGGSGGTEYTHVLVRQDPGTGNNMQLVFSSRDMSGTLVDPAGSNVAHIRATIYPPQP